MEASRIESLRELWAAAGLEAIETTEIDVRRTFDNFDDFWTTTLPIPILRPTFAAMSSKDSEILKIRVRERLPADAAGRNFQKQSFAPVVPRHRSAPESGRATWPRPRRLGAKYRRH